MPARGPRKYDPLTWYLADLTADEVTLTLTAIGTSGDMGANTMTRQMKRWQPRYPALASSLRAGRVGARLSQHDIAFHLQIPQPAYWLVERGMNRPTAAQLARLAALLELDADELTVLAGYARRGEVGM